MKSESLWLNQKGIIKEQTVEMEEAPEPESLPYAIQRDYEGA